MDRQQAQVTVDAYSELHTDLDAGFTLAQVDAQRAAVGPNRLPAAPRARAWRITLVQCAEPMTVMLAMVAIVSFAVD